MNPPAGSPTGQVPIGLGTLGTPRAGPLTAVFGAGADIDWRRALRPTMVAALTTSVLTLFLSRVCCLWLPLGGVLAVWLYHRKNPHALMNVGNGAKLGAVSGLFSYIFYLILFGSWWVIGGVFFHKSLGQEVRAVFQQSVDDFAARNPTPQAQEIVTRMSTPEGIATIATLGLLVFFFSFVLSCAIGGAAGAVLMRSEQQAPPGADSGNNPFTP